MSAEELLSDDLDLDDALQAASKENAKEKNDGTETNALNEGAEVPGNARASNVTAPDPPSPSPAPASPGVAVDEAENDEMEVEGTASAAGEKEAQGEKEAAMDIVQGQGGAERAEKGENDKAKSTSLMTSLFGGDSEEEEDESEEDWRTQAHAQASTVQATEEAPKDLGKGDHDDEDDDEPREREVRRDDLAQRRADRHLLDLQELRLTKQPYAKPDEAAKMVYVKPPLSLGFQPAVFDADLWNGEDIKPEYETDAAGRKRMKRKIFDMIRWRHKRDEHGAIAGVESNARLVTFDDKSTFLFVGKEAYEFKESMFRDYHHLFARHAQDNDQPSFLECQGVIEHKAVLVPLNVVAKQQTALKARVIVDGHSMTTMAKNKMASKIVSRVMLDPEKDKRDKEKLEATMIHLRTTYGKPSEAEQPPALTQEFLEASDDAGEYATPRRRTLDPNLERLAERRMLNAKRGRPEIEEDEDEEETGSLLDEEEDLFDEEEEDERPSKKRRK